MLYNREPSNENTSALSLSLSLSINRTYLVEANRRISYLEMSTKIKIEQQKIEFVDPDGKDADR